MQPSTNTALHDPQGLLDAKLPLDRAPYECLVQAVLAWSDTDILAERDYEQIALQLTSHARAIAADVRHRRDQLPADSAPRALTDVVLYEAEQLLAVKLEGTPHYVRARAQMVRALYERLDRLPPAPAPPGSREQLRGHPPLPAS
ncbi:restriction endonuclease [Streptomyces microflavus]|uniref:DUF6415 family natural product biosynthesis protein n=1 Tax=Streptomyces microflavus TaxID=1919 RepID=UPI00344D4065